MGKIPAQLHATLFEVTAESREHGERTWIIPAKNGIAALKSLEASYIGPWIDDKSTEISVKRLPESTFVYIPPVGRGEE